jgi:hypothetical protein
MVFPGAQCCLDVGYSISYALGITYIGHNCLILIDLSVALHLHKILSAKDKSWQQDDLLLRCFWLEGLVIPFLVLDDAVLSQCQSPKVLYCVAHPPLLWDMP